jgi:hypothetical protein
VSRRLPSARRALCGALLGVGAVACSGTQYRSDERAALATPVPFAEGDTGKPPLESDPEHQAAEAQRAREQPGPPTFAPDPAPLLSSNHYRLELRFHGGIVTVQGARQVHYDKPVASDRTLGRFAVELWIGRELLERVRFDFPLLGGPPPDPPRNGDRARPTFDSGADVVRSVLIAHTERATRAVLVDRATGEEWSLRWPPTSEPYTPEALGHAAPAVAASANESASAAPATPLPPIAE